MSIENRVRNSNGTFAKVDRPGWTTETWNDGWWDYKGYFHVYRPDYPNCNVSGFAFRYHIVWWLETGDVVTYPGVIHHRNEIKDDDIFTNLELLSTEDHSRHHNQPAPEGHSICIECGQLFTIIQWRLNDPKRGKFCTPECYYKNTAVDIRIVEYKGRIAVCECNWCEDHFEMSISRLGINGGKYCNRQCYYAYKRRFNS